MCARIAFAAIRYTPPLVTTSTHWLQAKHLVGAGPAYALRHMGPDVTPHHASPFPIGQLILC